MEGRLGTPPGSDFDTVHRLFLEIQQERLGGPIPVPPEAGDAGTRATSEEAREAAARWLRVLESGIGPHHFRRAIERLNPEASALEALVRYFAARRPLEPADAERLEWLLTWMCRNGQFPASEIARRVEAWTGAPRQRLSGTAEALLQEIVMIVEDVVAARTFQELAHSDLIARGRGIKQRFKEEFAHPAVLGAIVNYNLVTGRKFQQLLAEALPSAEFLEAEYRTVGEELRRAAAAGSAPGPGAATLVPGPPLAASAAPAAKPASPLPPGITLLGIDSLAQESQLLRLINELASYARMAGPGAAALPMPNSSLPVQPWELQALTVEYQPAEQSFRANFNRHVRRAVGLMAAMQEESALYDVRRHSQHLWKKHIDALVYAAYSGREALEALEALIQDSSRRGLQEKSEQLMHTAENLRQKVQQVFELLVSWKQQTGGQGSAYV